MLTAPSVGMCQLPPRLEIFGVGGLRLGDYWKSKGGPETHYGLGAELSQLLCFPWYVRGTSLTVPMRHEILWCTGPNSSGGHGSVGFNEEVQVRGDLETLSFFVGGAVPERSRSRSDPTHDTIGQTYPRRRGTVIRDPRRSDRKVQFVDAETACSDGVEPLPVVLSPRRHNGQKFCDVPGACDPLLVARAPPSVFRLRDRWRGTVTVRGFFYDSHVAACGLDGCHGYIVRREALASVPGEDDTGNVNIRYSLLSWCPGR